MKFLKKIEISFEIRAIFLRTISCLLIVSFLLVYFIASWAGNKDVINILSFNTSSAIFWIIVIFILIGHLDFFRDIVKDIARTKVSEFVSSEYFQKAIDKLLEDEQFKKGINQIANNAPSVDGVTSDQKEFNTGNKINK